MKEIYNVLEDLFRRCLKKSNVFSFYFERYESKSLALKTPNQNTSIWVFLKQIMLVGKCRLLKLLCNRLYYLIIFFFGTVKPENVSWQFNLELGRLCSVVVTTRTDNREFAVRRDPDAEILH